MRFTAMGEFNRLRELIQALEKRGGRTRIITPMCRTTFVTRIDAREMVDSDLEESG
jgi:hypothetical protein